MSESEQLREALINLELSKAREQDLRLESETLLQGLDALNRAETPDAVFRELLAFLKEPLGFDDAFILVRREDSRLAAAAATDPLYLGALWQPGDFFARVIEGQPAALFDVGQVKEWAEQPAGVLARARTALHMPLRSGPRAVVLVAVHKNRDAFGPKQIKIAKRFGPLASQALLNVDLRHSLAERDRFFTLSLDLMCIVTPSGRFKQFNPLWEKALGYSPKELALRTFWDVVHADDRAAAQSEFEKLRAGEAPVVFESRLVTRTGEVRWFQWSGAALREEGLCYAVGIDVTERRRQEEETQNAMSLLRSTLESTVDGILVVDAQGQITTFNRRFAELWDIPQVTLDTRDDQKAIAHVLDQLKEPEQFLSKVRELYAKPEAESYDVLDFKDGRVFERYSVPYRHGGKILGRVWSFRDVTARRRAEEHLVERTAQLEETLKKLEETQDKMVRSEKLAAIGQLAAGMAHELRNPLGSLQNGLFYIMDVLRDAPALGKDTDLKEILSLMEEEIRGATRIINNLLDFSRIETLTRMSVDVNGLLAHMLKGFALPANVRLAQEYDPSLPEISADPARLRQVFLNLALNAMQAMPQGGKLLVRTRRDGAACAIDFIDSGLGMTPEVAQRIFEPLFTTKAKGAGLGLSISNEIIERHGGTFNVQSAPGRGSTFTITLPFPRAA